MSKKIIVFFIVFSILFSQNFVFAQIGAGENPEDSLPATEEENAPSADNFVYSPLTGFEFSQGDSIGDAIKSMVMSTIVSSILSVVSGEVPTRGKDITTAITQTFTENFKQQLVAIKNDIRKMINESGDYIVQEIFSTTLQRVTKSLSKLQIKNPELYKDLNTYGGLITGMTLYTQNKCTDPAVMGCVTNAIRSALSTKNKNLDKKSQKGLTFGADTIIKNLKPCPESVVDYDIPNEEEIGDVIGKKKIPSKLSFNNFFKKIPFFADVLKAGSAKSRAKIGKLNGKSGGLSQVRTLSDIAEQSSEPTNSIGSFVDIGLKNNLTAMMCQDAVSGLLAMASQEAAKRFQEAEDNIKTGFRAQQECTDPIGADPNKGEICNKWGEVKTPASTLEQIAGWASTAEGDSLIARMNDPHGVNVISSWFGNWMYSKMDNILNKGFTEAANVSNARNTALVDLSKKETAEKACSDVASIGGGNLGTQLKQACIDAYRSQATIGAEFDKSQIQETSNLAASTFGEFAKLSKNFGDALNPTTFDNEINSNKEYLSSEIISEYIEILSDYEDLLGLISGLEKKLSGIAQNNSISSALNKIQQLNNPNNQSIKNINELKKEIASLQNTISTNQLDYQKQLGIVNQTLASSQLYELFYDRITSVLNVNGKLIAQPTSLNTSINFYSNLSPETALGSVNFSVFANNSVYRINQDIAPDRKTLQSSGLIQSTFQMLSEILDESHIPTNSDAQKISELRDYFNEQKANYEKLKIYSSAKNWDSEIIILSGVYSSQSVEIGPLLEQILKIVSNVSTLLNDIEKFNIVNKLKQIRTKESSLKTLIQEYQKNVDSAYSDLNKALASSGLDFASKESELDGINDEIYELNSEIDLLKNRINDFSEKLNNEIQDIQKEQNPPTEEPSSIIPQKSRIGFIQRTFTIINAPVKLLKNLIGNVLKLINAKRVKLK